MRRGAVEDEERIEEALRRRGRERKGVGQCHDVSRFLSSRCQSLPDTGA